MNALKRFFVAALAIVAVCSAATAQFRIGPRVGLNVNSMRLNKEVFDNENRAGFTGGVQVEFTVPIVNLGFDASVMYVHRANNNVFKNATTAGDANASAVLASDNYKKRDYIEIPVNFKYKLGLPVIGKVFSPYFFTGPSFAFLCSKSAITDAYKNKTFDVAWNFGVGLQFFSHLQIGASYGLGLTKTLEKLTPYEGTVIDGKNNYWTMTAAWLF